MSANGNQVTEVNETAPAAQMNTGASGRDAHQETAAGPREDKRSPIEHSGTSTSNSIIAADQVMRAKSTVFHMVRTAVKELQAAGHAVGMSDWSYGRAAYDRELFWLGKVDASLVIAIEQLETARVRLGCAVDMARRIHESQQAASPAREAST